MRQISNYSLYSSPLLTLIFLIWSWMGQAGVHVRVVLTGRSAAGVRMHGGRSVSSGVYDVCSIAPAPPLRFGASQHWVHVRTV